MFEQIRAQPGPLHRELCWLHLIAEPLKTHFVTSSVYPVSWSAALHPRKSLRNAIFSLWSRKLKAFVGSWFWLRRGTGWGFAIFVRSSVNANLEGVAISFKNHRWLNYIKLIKLIGFLKKTNVFGGPLDQHFFSSSRLIQCSARSYLSSWYIWYGNCRESMNLCFQGLTMETWASKKLARLQACRWWRG